MTRQWLQEWFITTTDGCFSGKVLIPNSDVVIDSFSLQQGEVDVDAVTGRHHDEPDTVLQNGVLIWKPRGVDGPVLRCHVVPARS